jgi:tetratricopeptide (TPR) repeat protein
MHRSVDGYSLPSDGRSFVLVNDGQKVGARGGTVHWSFARRLLDLLPPDEDVLLWYRATAAFLQSWDEYSELEPHLKRARELFPRDAALLLYEGALHETYAEPRIQDLFEIPPPRYGRALTKLIGDAKGEWQQAADRFEKALEVDPGLTEARIRLAHVRGMQRRHEEAAIELRRCLGEPLSPLMDYYASLLLGREEQTLGRREAAREAWARAVALYPGAQSPRLGLSQLARDEGDRASALGALELLNRPRGIEVDPWRTYSRGAHATGVDELFAEMRRRLAP